MSRGEAASTRRVALALLIAFFGIAGFAHLIVTDAMVRITPYWVPWPHAVVIATGLCEIAGAIGLILPGWRVRAGWAFAAYAVCVYPANVTHALHDLGTGHGLPLSYHVPRLLLQPVIVWWALWASSAVDWPFGRGAGGRRGQG